MGKSIKQQIYDAIWAGIANGEYPADYVFNERTLVEKFQVSKSPVRDALIELCSDGILRSIPRYGYEIVRIGAQEFQNITRLRKLLELDNLDAIVGHVSPQQIKQLQEQLRSVDTHLAEDTLNILDHWENNMMFHKQLYQMSNNQFGAALLDRCLKAQTVAYSTYRLYCQIDKKETLNHHEIVQCIAQNDLYGAKDALRRDLESLRIY